MSTEIDNVTFEDICKKWKEFKHKRDQKKISDPTHLTMLEREKMIEDLLQHYKLLEKEYLKLIEE